MAYCLGDDGFFAVFTFENDVVFFYEKLFFVCAVFDADGSRFIGGIG